jgi:hypothetical protein
MDNPSYEWRGGPLALSNSDTISTSTDRYGAVGAADVSRT